ncbi:hypothetical protein ACIBF5_09515 [Micromonospora sp. NPDC050417]|uniref:hypothetical protein n=1 Tax=Micromonospora sp. NPDC050417 TaxID=3364280 RepID=UPI0037BABECC
MNAVTKAAADLLTALGTVPDVVAYGDPGESVRPPATVLGPPALTWESLSASPTSARWLVYIVVPAEERALDRLWELVPLVAAAIDQLPDAVVIRADPGAFLSGAELPCYELTIEVALNG